MSEELRKEPIKRVVGYNVRKGVQKVYLTLEQLEAKVPVEEVIGYKISKGANPPIELTLQEAISLGIFQEQKAVKVWKIKDENMVKIMSSLPFDRVNAIKTSELAKKAGVSTETVYHAIHRLSTDPYVGIIKGVGRAGQLFFLRSASKEVQRGLPKIEIDKSFEPTGLKKETI